jgi:hypothetical protein
MSWFFRLAAHANLDIGVAKSKIKNPSCGDVHKFRCLWRAGIASCHEIVCRPGILFANRLCVELAQTRASGSNGLPFFLIQASRAIQPVVDNV